MRKRIFASIFFTSFIAVLLSSSFFVALFRAESSRALKTELSAEAAYIGRALDFSVSFDSYVSSISKNSRNRITLLSPDGTVIYDNHASPGGMDNHLSRPEIQSAIKNGFGESTRVSATLGDKEYYYALRLENGNILRVSATYKSLFSIFEKSLGWLILIFIFTLGISAFAARFLTDSIVSPINKLDLDSPFMNKEYEELSPLLLRMDKQNRRINKQLEELNAKQHELEHITNGMSEAMVILGSNGSVLSANRSARELFDCCEGASYLKLCRDIDYIRAVEKALGGSSENVILKRSGRVYQLSVSPVGGSSESGDGYAAVLFATDVTEKEESEKMRREFSANVSHELKTPLTSIMGYAEIIKNGIAKPGDIPRFSSLIHSEASRLLHLIEDIIKLSRLDEKDITKEFAPVNLLALAEIVKTELALKAKEKKVSVEVYGESLSVSGIRSTLHEMVFNLCDNAIAYNNPGGSVKIGVFPESGKTVLSVSDSGVGIAPEHQERIFERFYRVDKSHSKDTGGTGLGLSIVKHAAKLHGADIQLESAVGKGTTIRVVFN